MPGSFSCSPPRCAPQQRKGSGRVFVITMIGHSIDECTSLKYFLERSVKRGQIDEFVGPRRANDPPKPEPHVRDVRPCHVVDMIIGGGPQ